MKFLTPILLSVALVLPLPTAFAQDTQCNNTCQEKPRLFSVVGTAEMNVKPDRVTLVIGVKDQSEDLLAAKDKLNKTIQAAIAYCQSQGVLEKNIQLRSIDIRPVYQFIQKTGRDEFTHYNLEQKLIITLEDVDVYNELIFKLLEIGVNQVDSINFSSSEFEKFKNETRLQAIKAAQEKAKTMTETAGLKLGRIYNMSENSDSSYRFGGRYSANVGSIQDFSGGESDTFAAVGTILFKESVTLTYQLDD